MSFKDFFNKIQCSFVKHKENIVRFCKKEYDELTVSDKSNIEKIKKLAKQQIIYYIIGLLFSGTMLLILLKSDTPESNKIIASWHETGTNIIKKNPFIATWYYQKSNSCLDISRTKKEHDRINDIEEISCWEEVPENSPNYGMAKRMLGQILCRTELNKEVFQNFEISAKKGDMQGQYILGSIYEEGKHYFENDGKFVQGKPDYDKAFIWYSSSAKQGYPEAQNSLGLMYENGLGTDKNLKQAFNLYTESAKNKNSNAQNNLGRLYMYGNVAVAKNISKAKKYFESAEEQKNVKASYNLGLFYTKEKDLPKAIDKLDKAYKKCENVINHSSFYNDCINDVSVCRKLIEEDILLAKTNIGTLYYNGDGEGIDPDKDKACQIYNSVAEKGFPFAQYIMGLCYYQGCKTFSRNFEKAFNFFKSATEKGNAEAAFNLAVMYEKGEGIKKASKKEAEKTFRMAADLRKKDAERNLAKLQQNVDTQPEITKTAEMQNLKDLVSFADNNDLYSQVFLGLSYYHNQQYDKAIEYFSKALKNNESIKYKLYRFFRPVLIFAFLLYKYLIRPVLIFCFFIYFLCFLIIILYSLIKENTYNFPILGNIRYEFEHIMCCPYCSDSLYREN
ncbi:MAG: SEL1-like repeat protein, partial [Elusimicrobiales bacterium]|nr:SEL1-like repeat protein [Elusimicrobiales bacterium]